MSLQNPIHDAGELEDLEEDDCLLDDDDSWNSEPESLEELGDRKILKRYIEDDPERFMNFVELELGLEGPEVTSRMLEYLTDE